MSDVRDSLSSPWPIDALLLIAAGLIAPRISLQSPRPVESDRLKPIPAPSVPSRLWQDPMAAVELGPDESDAKDEADLLRKQADEADLMSIRRDVAKRVGADATLGLVDDERLLILPVMLAATPFRDDAEERRRMRYAVVSGLLAEGYAPSDAERINFVTWCPHPTVDPHARVAQPGVVPCAEHERVRLPYELFDEMELVEHGDGATPPVKPRAHRIALVLWLREADFYDDPLESLRQLSASVSPDGFEARSRMAVVGPGTSSLYVRLLTALDHELPPSYWNPRSVVRVIGGDDALVTALVDELGLRNLNPREFATDGQIGACADEIVLIVEEDYTYGRNLGRSFERVARKNCKAESGAAGASPVHVFTYLRGVDGQLPTLSDKKDEPPTLPSDRRRQQGEHAEGRSQYDYIQRLVDRVVDINVEGGTDRRVRAIGIFGSDVYDKLLILQALRSRLHDAVYFTTDLDARFLHHDQSDWTRNLVVVSHFGLQLAPEIQRGAPAFRGAYQTAAYFATRLAVEGQTNLTTADVETMRGKPRRFEIGRTRAVDLGGVDELGDCRWPASCRSVHSRRIDEVSGLHPLHGVAIVVFGTLVVLLTTRANQLVAHVVTRPKLGRERRKQLLGWLAVAVAGWLAAGALVGHEVAADSAAGRAEPFVWLQGVSAWPSHVIRLLALVAALVLAAVGLARLRKRARAIACALGLPERSDTAGARLSRPRRASDGPRWQRSDVWRRRIDWLRGPFVDFTRTERPAPGAEGEARVSVDRLWQRYLERTSGFNFWSWIVLATALFSAFAYALYRVDPPFFPHRGQAVAHVNGVLWVANVALLWATIFWTVFEARACAHLVNRLAATPSSWPRAALERRSRECGVPEVLLVESLDFELIVRAVDRVNPIVYVPFVQIFLFGFAFHSIFDDTDLPLPLVVIAALSLLYVLYAMLVLRHSADHAKRACIAHYGADILWLEDGRDNAQPSGYAKASGPEGRPCHEPLALDQLRDASREAAPAQIRMLKERIETTRAGPFRPLFQQPFLRALLIPFSGWSGVALIEPLLNYLGL